MHLDLCHSCLYSSMPNIIQFTEHVGRNYQPNYITAWRKAALVFMTHSLWGGWHHVEVHDSTWWIVRMEAMGFVYSDILTKEMREKVRSDGERTDLTQKIQEEGKNVNVGQHLFGTLLVSGCMCHGFFENQYACKVSHGIELDISNYFAWCFIGIHQPSSGIPHRTCAFICTGTIYP